MFYGSKVYYGSKRVMDYKGTLKVCMRKTSVPKPISLYYTILYYTILYYTVLYYILYTKIYYILYTKYYILKNYIRTIYYILYTVLYIYMYTCIGVCYKGGVHMRKASKPNVGT